MTSCHCFWNHHKLAIKWCFPIDSVIYAFALWERKKNLSFYEQRKKRKILQTKIFPFETLFTIFARKGKIGSPISQTKNINFQKDISSSPKRLHKMPICPSPNTHFLFSSWQLFYHLFFYNRLVSCFSWKLIFYFPAIPSRLQNGKFI